MKWEIIAIIILLIILALLLIPAKGKGGRRTNLLRSIIEGCFGDRWCE